MGGLGRKLEGKLVKFLVFSSCVHQKCNLPNLERKLERKKSHLERPNCPLALCIVHFLPLLFFFFSHPSFFPFIFFCYFLFFFFFVFAIHPFFLSFFFQSFFFLISFGFLYSLSLSFNEVHIHTLFF